MNVFSMTLHRGLSRAVVLLAAWGFAGATSAAPLAHRLLSLAPNLTELVYAAGAGDRLVGVVAYSDYPAAAQRVPLIGDAFRLDFERVMALRPDLVLAWGSGTPRENIDKLRSLGLRVEPVPVDHLEDIPRALEKIGEWAGTSAVAAPAAAKFRAALAAQRRQLASHTGVVPRVFIQIGRNPYYTVNDQHLIGEVVTLCGGRNVFGGLSQLAPVVGEEDIVATRPEVILVLDDGRDGGASAKAWQRWRQLPAVRAGRVHTVDSNTVARATPRVLDGMAAVCAYLKGVSGGR
jgi:iron complex transport system substrate-binding protein